MSVKSTAVFKHATPVNMIILRDSTKQDRLCFVQIVAKHGNPVNTKGNGETVKSFTCAGKCDAMTSAVFHAVRHGPIFLFFFVSCSNVLELQLSCARIMRKSSMVRMPNRRFAAHCTIDVREC